MAHSWIPEAPASHFDPGSRAPVPHDVAGGSPFSCPVDDESKRPCAMAAWTGHRHFDAHAPHLGRWLLRCSVTHAYALPPLLVAAARSGAPGRQISRPGSRPNLYAPLNTVPGRGKGLIRPPPVGDRRIWLTIPPV